MRQTAIRLNRTWLTILGILMLLGGLAVLLIGTGLLAPTARAIGRSLDRPTPSTKLFAASAGSLFAQTWVIIVVAVVGVVLGLLGLGWLLAQIPRSNEAKPFRLQDSAEAGLTRIAPSVLTDAVEDQIKGLPGVVNASAVLRGTAQAPDLTVKVTASDRARIPELLQTLQTRVADDFGRALDTRLTRLGVQVEVDTARSRTNRIAL
ncbi:hypothetical protein FHX74_003892 [Friedmanniella endophytica]|uniref:Alkaline shock response membrane anchor protein AmaP n=1 Tax=Microlunatus kandeliicorticis TaxID=1759536 RepID=A0A7W3IW09_9ACTN|nr:alkaline shock response membrane anchor protein AmaP [Microlunatus kandeliicorticis]MBA8796239.1 hypothetical protein [Microlunatus kandeliicorticis]